MSLFPPSQESRNPVAISRPTSSSTVMDSSACGCFYTTCNRALQCSPIYFYFIFFHCLLISFLKHRHYLRFFFSIGSIPETHSGLDLLSVCSNFAKYFACITSFDLCMNSLRTIPSLALFCR